LETKRKSGTMLAIQRTWKASLPLCSRVMAMQTNYSTSASPYEIFKAGDVQLQSGAIIHDCKLAYKTYGKLNAAKDNVIVYPTWYSGNHEDNEWLIGENMGLNPSKWFIVVPNLLGNGLSSSPSNTPQPFNGPRFPNVTFYDNIQVQHRLITEKFGIKKIKLVLGWSMGGGQTYQWAVSFPDMVENALPFCGSAKTSIHNVVFLEGVKVALQADEAWKEGWYAENAIPTKGLRALARVYAGWGFSQAFYREQLYKKMGYSNLEDFLVGFWEGLFLHRRDPNNLLTMLWTWQSGNIGNTPGFNGSLEKALGAIKARTIIMPGSTDLYFPPEDNEYEMKFLKNAEYRPINSIWGHFAGAGVNQADTQFIDRAVRDLLK